MSMIFVPGDELNDVLEVSSESFSIARYYDDPECTIRSTTFRGKYRKISKYIINPPKTLYEKWNLHSSFGDTQFPPLEKAQIPPVKDFNMYITMLERFIDSGKAKLHSQKIDKNPNYDPVYWQQEYEAQCETVAQAEAKGYHIY